MKCNVKQYQEDFLEALLGDCPDSLETVLIDTPVFPLKERLGVYQSNRISAYQKALGNIYPVLSALVGNECFEHWVRTWSSKGFSRDSDLSMAGENFDQFVADQPGLDDYPYLADMARLEWAIQVSKGVKSEEKAMPFEVLARLDEAAQSKARFMLSDQVITLSLDFPVEQIWQAFHEDRLEEGLSCEHSPRAILLDARGEQVRFSEISYSMFAFLDACQEGSTLEGLSNLAASGVALEQMITDAITATWLAGVSVEAQKTPISM